MLVRFATSASYVTPSVLVSDGVRVMFVLAVTSRSGTTVTPLSSAARALPAASARSRQPATANCCLLENVPFIIASVIRAEDAFDPPPMVGANATPDQYMRRAGGKYGMWRCTLDLQIKKNHRTMET